jgi:hypothetical protein
VPDQPSAAFISYCRVDQEFALRLAQDLKAAGAAVWLDQLDIRPGNPWDNAVERALRAATKMLVILTPTSVDSENVRDEIAYALKQGKIVIPVLYMECDIPLRLERKQHIDFRANYARGLDLLLRELRVDHPNQAVLEKAAEGDAQRQLAWQAREAEAQRRRLEEQSTHEQSAAREAAIQQAEAQRIEQLNSAPQSRAIATGHSERSEESQYLPPEQAIHARVAADSTNKSIHPALWLAGGIAAILILGFFFFHKSPSSHRDTASQSTPVAAQPAPQAAIPQPTAAAQPPSPSPSRTTVPPGTNREPKPAKAEIPPAPKAFPPQTTPASKPDSAALAAQGKALINAKRYAEALPMVTDACDSGSALGCEEVGLMYSAADGVAPDFPKGFTFYTKACDLGSTSGCTEIGTGYLFGTGVAADIQKAFSILTKTCMAGDASGCIYLGYMYDHPLGVAQDYRKAFDLYSKACDEGGAGGCLHLSDLYRLGHGVPVDLNLARQYMQKACDISSATGGTTFACNRLKEMQ